MKKLAVIICVLFTIIQGFSQEKSKENTSEITTYYFIRHAEKDETNKADRNPHLTDIGHKRAENWNTIFSNITFDAIYSTNYFRTLETAKPTATKSKLEITQYNPRNTNYQAFFNDTKGKTILIVGHSNSTPSFVNTILNKKKYEQIEHENYSNLYILTIVNDTKTSTLLRID